MSIEQNLKEKTEVVEIAEEEKATELKYVGTLKPKRNHRVYEINITTLSIKEAEFETQSDFVMKNGKIVDGMKKKIVVNDGCVYVSAMNAENAIKKFNKKIKEKVYKLEQLP